MALFQAAIRTFVSHRVLLYFVPKLAVQHTPFVCNYWEDITAFMELKLKMLTCHVSQGGKSIYVDPEHHKALALAAYQTGFGHTGGYAEAFRIHVVTSAPLNANR